MKFVTLCADDFGLDIAVSDAIIELVSQGILHATSCLVNVKYSHYRLKDILEYRHSIDLGLHLNLTEGLGITPSFKKGFQSIYKLLLLSHLKLLNEEHLKIEIHHQLELFIENFGFFPNYIDGHQHIHHLPQIRSALFYVLQQYNFPESFWCRSVTPMVRFPKILKSKIIEATGSIQFKNDLKKMDINYNSSFAGIYSLDGIVSFRSYMHCWLKNLLPYGLIMCHPSRITDVALDHLDARVQEYNYLKSDLFMVDICKHNVHCVRMSRQN